MILIRPVALSTDEVIDACLKGPVRGARKLDEAVVRAERAQIKRDTVALRAAIAGPGIRSYTAATAKPNVHHAMLWMYENRLRTAAAQHIRDEILALGAGGCPFCHAPYAPTLDHSFPKSAFPRLAVTPINLVPCCRDCNSERSTGTGTATINPYIDAWVEDRSWIRASIPDPAYPEVLRFEARPRKGWSTDKQQAVKDFFSGANLSTRYALTATQEFSSRASYLLDVLTASGTPGLRDEMATERRMHKRTSPNHWGAVTYKAWLSRFDEIDWRVVLKRPTLLVHPNPGLADEL